MSAMFLEAFVAPKSLPSPFFFGRTICQPGADAEADAEPKAGTEASAGAGARVGAGAGARADRIELQNTFTIPRLSRLNYRSQYPSSRGQRLQMPVDHPLWLRSRLFALVGPLPDQTEKPHDLRRRRRRRRRIDNMQKSDEKKNNDNSTNNNDSSTSQEPIAGLLERRRPES